MTLPHEAFSLQVPERVVLSESVYSTLRQAILDGTLAPGTRIVEEALAKQLRVSRAPLREALWLLKRDGLVVEKGLRDTRVVTLSEDEIRELHLLRSLLETVAYQRASRHLDEVTQARLTALVDDMAAAADEDDHKAVARIDYEFHQTLCHASGLPRLHAIWDQQQVLFRLWLNLIGSDRETTLTEVVESHRALLEVVVARDDAAINEHVIHHVYEVGGILPEQRRGWAAEQPRLTFPVPQGD